MTSPRICLRSLASAVVVTERTRLPSRTSSLVIVSGVMRPLGMFVTLSAVLAVAVSLWTRRARGWLLASIVPYISGMFLLSMLYLWPRWPILFDDRALYTVDELHSTVQEIWVAHAVRVACGLLTAIFAVIAALRIYRDRILLQVEQANSVDYSSSPSVSR
ncbi:hypothetical protein [Nocardia sp. NPDC058666]|uniref:hypothetical protein n=1 Tax=Nocardia sp. NPDC058666 TaxID=3346587 RepID=UPI00365BCA98